MLESGFATNLYEVVSSTDVGGVIGYIAHQVGDVGAAVGNAACEAVGYLADCLESIGFLPSFCFPHAAAKK
jgi:hypothetical protein